MIGTNLNLDLPSASDTIAVMVAKTRTCLSSIQDSLADKATPAGLDITSELSLGGNLLTNVGGVAMVSGNTPTAVGSMYYDGTAFFVRDATGIIQLTSLGAINVAGVGGIGGDYGGSNPASVVFDNASGEYRFTEDPGVYADVRVDDVILVGSAGTVRLGVTADITTDRSILIKSLPTSGLGVLVYDSSDSTLKATDVVDEDVTFASVTGANDVYFSTGRSYSSLMAPAVRLTNCGLSNTTNSSKLVSTAPSWWWTGAQLPLSAGDQINTVYAAVTTAVSGNISIYLVRKVMSTGAETLFLVTTFNPGTSAGVYGSSVSSPTPINAGELWFIRIDGAASGVSIDGTTITYIRPKP